MVGSEPLPHRAGVVARVGALVGAMAAMGAIGAGLAATDHVVYPSYGAAAAVADQHTAGGIMSVTGMLIVVPALVAVAAGALSAEERRQRRRELVQARYGALLLLVLLVGGVGIAAVAAPRTDAAPAGSARGRSLFAESCASCHGFDGSGVAHRGPSLLSAGAAAADFYLTTGRMPLASPDAEPERGKPRFGRSDIRALTAYVASLGDGPAIPSVDPDRGDVREGRSLFADSCSGCHQIVTKGGIAPGLVAPSLAKATPTQIAEAIRVGPYLMPHFGPRQLDDHQVASIARYVTTVGRHPPDRGGWGIGNLGPIPEGLVAFGLLGGVLVAGARQIGERS